MEKCPICKDWRGENSKKISRKRASRTAHQLAVKKADEGIEGLEWEEVYTLFFPKIYRHEYERNILLEREIELQESIKRNIKHPDVCDYHRENVENFPWAGRRRNEDTMKRRLKNYSQSKWPNPLKIY